MYPIRLVLISKVLRYLLSKSNLTRLSSVAPISPVQIIFGQNYIQYHITVAIVQWLKSGHTLCRVGLFA